MPQSGGVAIELVVIAYSNEHRMRQEFVCHWSL